MPLPASGAISLGDIQTEMGGANPISLNEYYYNGGYTSLNNTGVPSSGTISLSNFRSTYKTFTNAEIFAIMNSGNYYAYRNQLTSAISFGSGLETNTAQSFDVSGPNNRYSTSVSASYTWSTSAFAKLSYITVVIRNFSITNSFVTSVVYNGTTYATASVNNASTMFDNRVSYVQIPIGYGTFDTGTLSVTYNKTSNNSVNGQEMYILPGKWNLVYNANNAASTTNNAITLAVFANDFVMGLRARPIDNSNISSGTYSGATYNTVMNRESHWYYNYGVRNVMATSTANITFTPATYTTGPTDALATYYEACQVMTFRLEKA
jgi:hypothetical protein